MTTTTVQHPTVTYCAAVDRNRDRKEPPASPQYETDSMRLRVLPNGMSATSPVYSPSSPKYESTVQVIDDDDEQEEEKAEVVEEEKVEMPRYYIKTQPAVNIVDGKPVLTCEYHCDACNIATALTLEVFIADCRLDETYGLFKVVYKYDVSAAVCSKCKSRFNTVWVDDFFREHRLM